MKLKAGDVLHLKQHDGLIIILFVAKRVYGRAYAFYNIIINHIDYFPQTSVDNLIRRGDMRVESE